MLHNGGESCKAACSAVLTPTQIVTSVLFATGWRFEGEAQPSDNPFKHHNGSLPSGRRHCGHALSFTEGPLINSAHHTQVGAQGGVLLMLNKNMRDQHCC